MSITITITDPTPAQIAALFGTQDNAKPETAAKREPKAKAEEPAAEEPKGDDVPTKEDAVAAAQKLVGANGRDALAELLGEFKAENLSGLKPAQRADFIAKCNEKTA